jgi:hypothetical protein
MRRVYYNETARILFILSSLIVILCTNRFKIKTSLFCPKRLFRVSCMLLTTESNLFTVCIYLICITTETVFVFTLRCQLKLYILFRLLFVCKGLISCVYDMMLRVSIFHIICRCTCKVIVYSVTNRLMKQCS